MGWVEFPGVFDSLGEPFTDGVEMWELPVETVFDSYLRGEITDKSLLALMLK